jgi:CRP-like cAMP-binding protein
MAIRRIEQIRNSQPTCPSIEPAAVGFFRGLTKTEIYVVKTTAVKRKFKASEIIARCAEPAVSLFLVEKGCVNYSVVTSDGREVLLERLAPGDVFGITALLSETPSDLGTAKAVNDTEVLAWDCHLIRQLAKAYPRLCENALAIALRSITYHAERHVGLFSKTARERVASALTNLGARVGRVLADGIEIDIKNEDLASLADVNLFTASRLLQLWERKGILTKSRGRVLIRFPEKLFAA